MGTSICQALNVSLRLLSPKGEAISINSILRPAKTTAINVQVMSAYSRSHNYWFLRFLEQCKQIYETWPRVDELIETKIKWSPFCRRFQIYFLDWQCLYFLLNFHWIISMRVWLIQYRDVSHYGDMRRSWNSLSLYNGNSYCVKMISLYWISPKGSLSQVGSVFSLLMLICLNKLGHHLSKKHQGIILSMAYPDSKVHGANMGPIWGRQDPGGPHVGPMNFAIWVVKSQW